MEPATDENSGVGVQYGGAMRNSKRFTVVAIVVIAVVITIIILLAVFIPRAHGEAGSLKRGLNKGSRPPANGTVMMSKTATGGLTVSSSGVPSLKSESRISPTAAGLTAGGSTVRAPTADASNANESTASVPTAAVPTGHTLTGDSAPGVTHTGAIAAVRIRAEVELTGTASTTSAPSGAALTSVPLTESAQTGATLIAAATSTLERARKVVRLDGVAPDEASGDPKLIANETMLHPGLDNETVLDLGFGKATVPHPGHEDEMVLHPVAEHGGPSSANEPFVDFKGLPLNSTGPDTELRETADAVSTRNQTTLAGPPVNQTGDPFTAVDINFAL